MTIRVTLYLEIFGLLATTVLLVLVRYVYNISDVAPDALHFIGFVALIPMISSVGGRWSNRKISYIKNSASFKPLVVATFLAVYLSLIPWILSFFISDNTTLIYIDWSVVLLSIALSFIFFILSLFVFLKE